jgi:hypothetical protein
MDIFSIVLIVFLILTVLAFLRNEYTHHRVVEALYVVYRYNVELIESGEYTTEMVLDYDKTLYGYDEYFLTIALWGKFTAIRPKYRELLKPYLY